MSFINPTRKIAKIHRISIFMFEIERMDREKTKYKNELRKFGFPQLKGDNEKIYS